MLVVRLKLRFTLLILLPLTNVVVDGFNTAKLVHADLIHILTHFHTDHRQGLTTNFRGRILCSRITAELVKSYGVMEGCIEILDMRTPYKVKPPEGRGLVPFTITFVDANHCPGSVAVIVESESFSYFVSGDICVTKSVIASCMKIRPQGFDIGYIDSTFYDKHGEWDIMPTVDESVAVLVDFLSKSTHRVAFEFDLLGTEVLLEAVLKSFPRDRIGIVGEKRLQDLEIIYSEFPHVFARFVPIYPENCPFRFCVIPRATKIPEGFIRLRASTQRWAPRIRNAPTEKPFPLLEVDMERGEAFLFFSFHSCKREIDMLIRQLTIEDVRFIVKAIEVDRQERAPTRNNDEPPQKTRRERCRRFPFQFSTDDMWLESLIDSQETIVPDFTEYDSLTLPTWRE